MFGKGVCMSLVFVIKVIIPHNTNEIRPFQ